MRHFTDLLPLIVSLQAAQAAKASADAELAAALSRAGPLEAQFAEALALVKTAQEAAAAKEEEKRALEARLAEAASAEFAVQVS